MDYIEGRTLYQVIQAQEMLGRPRRLQLIEDLCAGLGYAHRHKLVHRDIKPANLIIDSSTGSLKILDFGVVRRIGSASTVGVPVGTFCYMSPEQTKGAATLDHRSDIFAVGLVFYELMSGTQGVSAGQEHRRSGRAHSARSADADQRAGAVDPEGDRGHHQQGG